MGTSKLSRREDLFELEDWALRHSRSSGIDRSNIRSGLNCTDSILFGEKLCVQRVRICIIAAKILIARFAA